MRFVRLLLQTYSKFQYSSSINVWSSSKIKKETNAKLSVSKSFMKWQKKNQKALKTVVSAVTNPTLLDHLGFDKGFILHIGVSANNLECAMYRKHKGYIKGFWVLSKRTIRTKMRYIALKSTIFISLCCMLKQKLTIMWLVHSKVHCQRLTLSESIVEDIHADQQLKLK